MNAEYKKIDGSDILSSEHPVPDGPNVDWLRDRGFDESVIAVFDHHEEEKDAFNESPCFYIFSLHLWLYLSIWLMVYPFLVMISVLLFISALMYRLKVLNTRKREASIESSTCTLRHTVLTEEAIYHITKKPRLNNEDGGTEVGM